MVFSQVKINPGRGLVQLPHPWGNKILAQGMAPPTVFEAIICPDPDTAPIGIYFAKAVPTAATGTVPCMFRAT